MKSIEKNLRAWLHQRDQYTSHRQLLLISGEQKQNIELAQICAEHFDDNIFITKRADHNAHKLLANEYTKLKALPASGYKQVLGKNISLVVYDAYDGIKPSAVLAAEGCIKQSGLFVLLTPPLGYWPTHEANQTGIKFSYGDSHDVSHYTHRLCTLLAKNSDVALIEKNQLYPTIAIAEKPERYASHIFTDRNKDSDYNTLRNPKFRLTETQESLQKQILARLLPQNKSTARQVDTTRISVISGRRGRGKSSLLGSIAHKAIMQGLTVYISAPTKRNCAQVIDVCKALSLQERCADPTLIFVAPDQIHSIRPSAQDILMIDEAAAIAPNTVISACHQFTQIVLTTTVIGYEGSGLGFNFKVLPSLIEYQYDIKHVELTQPLRWFKDDPLEELFEIMFSPNAPQYSKQQQLSIESINKNELVFQIIDTTILKQSCKIGYIDLDTGVDEQLSSSFLEQELLNIFNLLAQAHYQTTPDDLMRLFDAQDQYIATLKTQNGVLIAAAIVIKEQLIIDSLLAKDVADGSRRLSGHLSSQSIATMLLDPNVLQNENWRISRIAVKQDCQSKEFGSLLVDHIKNSAVQQNVDMLCTSYGLDVLLHQFWTKNAFNLVKLGLRKDTASALHSGLMTFALTDKAQTHQRRLLVHFGLSIKFNLGVWDIPQDLMDLIQSTRITLNIKESAALLALYSTRLKLGRITVDQSIPILYASPNCVEDKLQKTAETLTTLIDNYRTKGNSAQLKKQLRQDIINIASDLWA